MSPLAARWSAPLLAASALLVLAPTQANAAPGVANRLGGANAQGPATPSVTGIYHNPAMLGFLDGLHFQATLRAGVEHLNVRRFGTDPSTGEPTSSLGGPVNLANPTFDYFVGASFLLDPIAIGAAVHTYDSRFRIRSNPALYYHLVGDDDFGCQLDSGQICPTVRSGGMVDMRTDFDLSLAWNATPWMSVGATVHFPRQRTYLAQDVDSALTGVNSDTGCAPGVDPVEDPECAERLAFRGNTRLRLFGLREVPSTRLDFALTAGVAFDIRETVTLGIRYRTQPLLEGGELTVNGEAAVCLPGYAARNDLPACEVATPVTATLTEIVPRELAIGAAGNVGNWRLDGNLYWIDRCPGGIPGRGCANRDRRLVELVGLDGDASTLPDATLYRGYQDLFGGELWARYRLDDIIGANLPYFKVLCSGSEVDPETGERVSCVPRMDLLLGAGLMSPGVQPESLSPAYPDGWTLQATLGTSFNLPSRNGVWSLVPAYGVDFLAPTRVGSGGRDPAYSPSAAVAFEQGGADINDPSADAVLSGRARPTNAGRYTGAVHTLMFGLRWSERSPDGLL
ncbi:hypothetical protein PPSIR1_12443 [Plesiocystis pacifica SIR-1]|uniref:Uncharacterized protein n=1 Tax=Plesiocystis pacifica SIR-1 TaxID=391625 RepID=A6FZZ3_9BACT|nr:hypothetical protein [Plesiocystis pacifica]EDM80690.1 hypothetical protein PPSIR1_12443 [Plesiocystis pacifica SIR-1]